MKIHPEAANQGEQEIHQVKVEMDQGQQEVINVDELDITSVKTGQQKLHWMLSKEKNLKVRSRVYRQKLPVEAAVKNIR